ncbi:hypothetical protein ACHAWF_003835 [Thalassiosira exigua]
MTTQAKSPILRLLDEHLLSISSFLSVHDIRSLASSRRSIRRALATGDAAAKVVWADRMQAAFPAVFSSAHPGAAKDEGRSQLGPGSNSFDISFVDEYKLPVSGLADAGSSINLPLLTSLLAPRYPQTIDAATLRSRSGSELFRSYALHIGADNTIATTDERQNATRVPVVQFEGQVGTGDRCIRSDRPFPPSRHRVLGIGSCRCGECVMSLSPCMKNLPRSLKDLLAGCISNSSNGNESHLNVQSPLFHFLTSLSRDNDTDQSLDAKTHLLDVTTHVFSECVANDNNNDVEVAVYGQINEDHSIKTRLEQCVVNFCRRAEIHDHLCPFVAPTPVAASAIDTQDLVIDVTPRLVAYFEATIVKQDGDSSTVPQPAQPTRHGNQRRDECIAIGLSNQSFAIESKMPGWDGESYGWHGDDGGFYHGQKMNLQPGPSFGAGDTVGCGFDYSKRTMFFTKNGVFLRYAFGKVSRDVVDRGLYPTVGVDSECPVFANFGAHPFKFDLNKYGKEGHK